MNTLLFANRKEISSQAYGNTANYTVQKSGIVYAYRKNGENNVNKFVNIKLLINNTEIAAAEGYIRNGAHVCTPCFPVKIGDVVQAIGGSETYSTTYIMYVPYA